MDEARLQQTHRSFVARLQQAMDAEAARQAEQVADEARADAPSRTGELRSKISAEGANVHSRAAHSLFVEFGTVHMAAQPFLRPAAARNQVRGPQSMAQALRNVKP